MNGDAPPRRIILVVVLYLSVFGSAPIGHAQVFFESQQSYRQTIALVREAEVVVESSVPEPEVALQRGTEGQVILDITGRFGIAGYHGSREAAGARELSGPELTFRLSRTAGTLTLSSPEWTHIHHALLIGCLTVTLPEGIVLRVRQISRRELEGRR